MRNSNVTSAIAVLVTAGALAAGYVAMSGGGEPSFDSRPHRAIGRVMAEQALKLLKPGGRITVITRDTAQFRSPASVSQLSEFNKALREAHAAINSVQALQVDPLRPMEVPPGDFFELIRKAPDGDVFVSFMGPPLLNEVQRYQLGETGVKIVAFCPGAMVDRVNLPGLFEQHLLHAAVVSRRDAPRSSAKPGTLRGWFDQSFQEVTAANVASFSLAASRDSNK